MKLKFLFPYWTRYLGCALVLAHIPIVAARRVYDSNHPYTPNTPDGGPFANHHLFFLVTLLLMVIGLFLVAFSKEKIEDEQISQLRLDSLQWAVYLNYFILIISLVFVDPSDIKHILELNLWVPLVFFILRFRWVIFRLGRSLN
jgi:DNA-binding XRE family transcriptional regulator